MFQDDRASSRPSHTHQLNPTSKTSHLNERTERNRRIRRGRLLDDLLLTGWRRAGRGDVAGALRCFEDALAIDGDRTETWLGLARVFRLMHDPARADRCLGVARRLARTAALQAPATA